MTMEADLPKLTTRSDGHCDWVGQARIIELIRFERVVLRPRLAIAAHGLIFETLCATKRQVLCRTRVAKLPGLQDVDLRVVGPSVGSDREI